MKTLKELLARMKALVPEISELSGKAKDCDDEAKAAGFLAVMADRKTEFAACEKRIAEIKEEAAMAKSIADAEAMDAPDPNAFNTNPDGQPGAKTAPGPDGKAGEGLCVVNGKTIDTRQSANRIYNFKRNAFLDMVSAGDRADGKRGYSSLTVEQGNAIRPTGAKRERFMQGKSGLIDPVMVPEAMAHAILGLEGKAVMLSTDTVGGATDSGSANLIDPNFIPQLIEEPVVIPSYWDRTTRINAYNGRWDYPKLDKSQGNFGGVTVAWQTTEGSAKTETEPSYTDFTGTTDELAALVYVSKINLSRSAIGLEADITKRLRQAVDWEISRTVKYGTGSNQPLGILNGSALLTLQRALADKVDWTNDIIGLCFGLTQGFRMGAQFIMDDSVEKYTNGIVDSLGRPLYTSDVNNGPVARLNGYSYQTDEYGAAESTPIVLGDEGDMIFGNLKHYASAVEQDVAIESSEHFRFDKGQVAIRLMFFAGGKPIYEDAFITLTDPA